MDALQRDIALPRLFEYPTIRRLSAAIEEEQSGKSSLEPISPVSKDQPLPLSFSQERLWFLDQFEAGQSIAFNLSTALHLEGKLNIPALKTSLAEIVRRHESLRTVFITDDGRPAQKVLPPPMSFPLPAMTVNSTDFEHHIQSEVKQPFDLETGPVIRGRLYHLDDDNHILLIIMHHIVSDGWSLDIFFRELTRLYAAFSNGDASPLPPLRLQYGDYAHWQRTYQESAVFNQQLDYWQETLSGTATVLELPTDHPRPTVQTQHGRHHTFILPTELSAAIRRASIEQQSTLFMFLLAAFQLLLARYSGQDDFLVGTPIAGRNQADAEEIIGFFLNTLVLRADLTGNPTFQEFLAQVRRRALEAYSNQDIPIEKLIDELNPVRDMSRSPLFQVLFALQNMPWSGYDLPGLAIRPLDSYNQSAKIDLSLYMMETADGLQGIFEYNSNLFDETTIARMAGHYEQLLRSAVSNPKQPASSLSMLSISERRQLLTTWNQTDRPYPKHETLVGLFSAQVRKTPQAATFIAGKQSITYSALNRKANQVANLLLARGIGPGMVVGISLSRSIEMMAALLGILKTGAAYLPLDPGYPAERLTFMAADAGMAALLTEESAQQTFSGLPVPIISLDARPNPLQDVSDADPPPVNVSPDAVAYLIYTSGSTGRPKGVAVPHKQIINRLNWMWRDYPFQPNEVGCQRTALNFVDSIWEIFGPLLQGIPTVIIPDEVVQDPAQFVAALGTHSVSRLWLVPSLLRVMLDTMPDLAEKLPKLKFWVTSGETIPMELFRRFQERMPNAVIFNLYGTSEVWDVTWYPPEADHVGLNRVPIGKPIDNMQTYILDENMRLLPIGVPGDLYVGGEGLAHSYLGRPSHTATTFVPHPFSQKPGARLNRTGDLARYLPDGQIEFFGRRDFQIKVRGFRIEPGEVESTLLQHSAVKTAVVAAPETTTGERRLIAYVVSRTDPPPPVDELREYLGRTLPEPMIPGLFIFLEQLPLTPSGKVDRQALPQPDSSRPELAEQYIAPRNPAEKVVVDIWQEVLDLSKVGIHDNFFALGGHSLLATQVTFKLQERFRVNFPLYEVFNKPTVAGTVETLIQFWGDQDLVEEIARTWEIISQMSAEEAEELLAEAESSD
jgi:amino acid adenylation domain-containing protein